MECFACGNATEDFVLPPTDSERASGRGKHIPRIHGTTMVVKSDDDTKADVEKQGVRFHSKVMRKPERPLRLLSYSSGKSMDRSTQIMHLLCVVMLSAMILIGIILIAKAA
jgi:hypothetical protein